MSWVTEPPAADVRRRPSQPGRAQVSNIQGALLGLFALLLGFTFAMALSRFDARKQMVVRQSNAIGTAALRSQFLPAPERAEAVCCFAATWRFASMLAAQISRCLRNRKLDAETSRLQERLWAAASAGAETDPRSIPVGLFIGALNDLIDVKSERDAALAYHVPESVLLLLFGFAIASVEVAGYGNGLVCRARFREPGDSLSAPQIRLERIQSIR